LATLYLSTLEKKMTGLTCYTESFERESREKYNNALCHLRDEQPANWFQQLLNEDIIPQLSQIGFESKLCQALFQIALPSWQQMGAGVAKCLWIHPRLAKDLNIIRKATIRIAEEKRNTQAILKNMSSDDIYDHVRESMEPENLTSLHDDIVISWIILPRAYSLLQENDGCCLISYLKYLKREKRPDFKKLLARITTEFVANFSLKYATPKQPKQPVIDAIFYGYATMFWKNLASPSDGCEGLTAHYNFLAWADAFQKRTSLIDDDMIKTVKELTAAQQGYLANRSPALQY
jgi:uncharacterized protein YqcC (DUF446 family)